MKRITVISTAILLIFIIGLGVFLWLAYRFGLEPNDDDNNDIKTTSELVTSSTSTVNSILSTAAVATTSNECTDATVGILQRGGSAVDAAICATLCQGVTVPQASGIGGGFLATIFIKETNTVETLNAREVAPLKAHRDMYNDTSTSSSEGGLSIAVPTEVKGLWELHKKYGKLPWAKVIEPVIEVAENGFKVNNYLASVLMNREDKIRSLKGFHDLYINPNNDEVYKEGDLITNQKLAKTLRIIAEEGADAIYNVTHGSLARKIVEEIQAAGGIVTLDDLQIYSPRWGESVTAKLFNGDTIHSVPLPSSGSILTFVMEILEGYKFHENSFDFHQQDKLIYHRIVEAFKFAFGARTKLGDEINSQVIETLREIGDFELVNQIRALIKDDTTSNETLYYRANGPIVEDNGTGHVSILAPNGDAVSITSTINLIFGSWVMSESTGIIYNDEMDDFTKPISGGLMSSPSNYIRPAKCPMSSMTPMILLDENKDVSLVVGAAGGILIMTSLILFLVNVLYLNQTMEASMTMKRFHHQLDPMRIRFENGYDQPDIRAYLTQKGHASVTASKIISGFASVIAISRRNGVVETSIDPRRGGKGTVFDIDNRTFN